MRKRMNVIHKDDVRISKLQNEMQEILQKRKGSPTNEKAYLNSTMMSYIARATNIKGAHEKYSWGTYRRLVQDIEKEGQELLKQIKTK